MIAVLQPLRFAVVSAAERGQIAVFGEREFLVELRRTAVQPFLARREIIVVADGHEVGDSTIETIHGFDRDAPFLVGVVVRDVAQVEYASDIPGFAVLDNPLRLRFIDFGMTGAIMLRVG